MSIRVAVAGASGKLGSVVTRLVTATDGFDLVAELNSKTPLTDMLGTDGEAPDVVVDVTNPAVSSQIIDFAIEHGANVLVGTSGWNAERISRLRYDLEDRPAIGVIIIPNFSLGSALATAFATVASRFYDSVEIIEAHGAGKIDSPSGTAVRTAELIADARTDAGPVDAPHADQRARGQQVAGVPVHSLRMQGVVASQRVVLGGAGEVLTISHDTLDSSAYEAGILRALKAVATARGVSVGLDALIDLGIDDVARHDGDRR